MNALTGIEQRVADLEATVRRLESQLEESKTTISAERSIPLQPGRQATEPERSVGVSRRRMLVGGAAAGVLGAAVNGLADGGERVAAANGDPLKVGLSTSATASTRLATSNDRGLYVSGGSIGGEPAKLSGFADGVGNGVMGLALDHDQFANGFGVVADAFREGSFVGNPRARAQLYISPSGSKPTSSSFNHFAGEIVVDQNSNSLWYCAVAGTPGSWKRIAGANDKTPAQLEQRIDGVPRVNLIRPRRVYDSRFGDGRLNPGKSREVSVRSSIDIETGKIVTLNLVPSSATGILFNIAAIGTQVGGFLSVTPSNATEFSAASINWSETGQVLNNGTTSTVFKRAVRVWCGGLGGADFTIDVTGYVV